MRIPKGGIAFFDSGIGGLTVLHAYRQYIISDARTHMEVPLYYLGDNKRAPYGNLKERQIRRNVQRAFRVFRRLKVSVAVLACNTVTAVCIEELRKKYAFPIVGTEPAVRSAAKAGGQVFVLATKATCDSDRFQSLCERVEKEYPSAEIIVYPCEGLAGEIERHFGDLGYDYTASLPCGRPSSVVLGCTHYTYVKEQIQAYYGGKIYDGAEGVSMRILTVFEECCQKNRDGRPPKGKKSKKIKKTTTFHPQKAGAKSEKTKANKCSRKYAKMGEKRITNTQKPIVFFLGAARKTNENAYKQMFGVKDFSKNGKKG